MLARPEVTYADCLAQDSDFKDHGKEINEQIEIAIKYAGYIRRQTQEIERLQSYDQLRLPEQINYDRIVSLSNEARLRLKTIRPENIGQASRLEGVTSADISILLIAIKG